MSLRPYYIIVAIIAIVFANRSMGQSVEVAVDKKAIFIGEQVKLTISLNKATPGARWNTLPDSVNHFEVVGRSKIDTIVHPATVDYRQTIMLTSFDSGVWQIPLIQIGGITQQSPPPSVNVMPVDVSQLQDYNDIKDIEPAQAGNSKLIIGAIVLGTLLSALIVAWLFYKNKKTATPPRSAAGGLSPLDWAIAELNRLKASQPKSPAEVKKFYTELSEVSRSFFNRQLQQTTVHKTTDEWMLDLHSLTVDNTAKTAFFQFLRMADAIKFARYQPPSTEYGASIEAVEQIVQKVSLLNSPLYSKYQPR